MPSHLLLTAALAVLVWSGIVLARASLVGTALAVLLVGGCVGDSLLRVDLGPVPLSVDRVLLLVLVAQYAIYRRWGQVRGNPPVTADYVLGGFLLVLAASTITHDYGIDRFAPLGKLASLYLLPAVIYWMVRQSEWTARTAWCVFAALAAFGVYLSLVLAAESQRAWEFAFAGGGVPQFVEFVGRGVLSNPPAAGLLLTLAMCAALAFWPSASRAGKWLISILAATILVGVYNTHSPSAWLGAGGALVLMTVLGASRGPRLRMATAVAATAAIVAAVGWYQLQAVGGDEHLSAQATRVDEFRPELAVVAWHMYLDHPILGVGLGHYAREAPAYLANHTDTPLAKHAGLHAQQNVFLGLLTETGFLGTAMFVMLLACWTAGAWRLSRADTAPTWARQMGAVFLAFMIAYLAGGMFHDLSVAPMVNMFLFFLGGAVMGLSALFDAEPHRADRGRLRLRDDQQEDADKPWYVPVGQAE